MTNGYLDIRLGFSVEPKIHSVTLWITVAISKSSILDEKYEYCIFFHVDGMKMHFSSASNHRGTVAALSPCCRLSSLRCWQHVVGHHVYTNVYGADPDLPEVAEGDARRIVARQKWSSMYKYQHIYMPVLYGLLALKVIG